MNNIKYVGMDVHKSITVIVVLNELGQFESRSQVKTKSENICDFFRGISGKVEVVFEARVSNRTTKAVPSAGAPKAAAILCS